MEVRSGDEEVVMKKLYQFYLLNKGVHTMRCRQVIV